LFDDAKIRNNFVISKPQQDFNIPLTFDYFQAIGEMWVIVLPTKLLI